MSELSEPSITIYTSKNKNGALKTREVQIISWVFENDVEANNEEKDTKLREKKIVMNRIQVRINTEQNQQSKNYCQKNC